MTAQEAADQYGAQMYLPWPGDPTGETPQMFYRWETSMCNDRSIHTSLQYLTFANLWHCSGEKDHHQFAKECLKPIPGGEPHDPVAWAIVLTLRRAKIDKEIAEEDALRAARKLLA